jgi:hypothetical protein
LNPLSKIIQQPISWFRKHTRDDKWVGKSKTMLDKWVGKSKTMVDINCLEPWVIGRNMGNGVGEISKIRKALLSFSNPLSAII